MNSKGNMTAVEFLADELHGFIHPEHGKDFLPIIEQAKQIEKEEIHKRQLMLGKVSEIIGFEKTVELWKECIETFENKNHETE